MSITENMTIAQIKALGRSKDEALERGMKMLNRVGLNAQDGMTMMCVTHEMEFARKVADRVIFMDEGKIIEDATKDDFFGTQRSERANLFLSKILQH